MKEKRYKRMKKAIMAGASSGIVAGLILMGPANTVRAETLEVATSTYSQNASTTGMHLMHRWNKPGGSNYLATTLGLNKDEVKAELKSGKTMKQILQDHGITPEEIQKAFVAKPHHKMKGWMKNA